MKEELFRLTYRTGVTVDALVTHADNARGVCVLMHGLGGLKEQEHLVEAARVLAEHGFTAVRPDAADDIGVSDAAVTGATATKRRENVEDAVAWALTQPFGSGVLLVGGHSLGGIAAGEVCARDARVQGAVLLAPVVSGDMQWLRRGLPFMQAWKAAGMIPRDFATKKGTVFQLGYELNDDARAHSLIREAHLLARVPTLLVVGKDDDATPADELEMLAFAIGRSATLHVIPDTKHNFRGTEPIVGAHISAWLAATYPRT